MALNLDGPLRIVTLVIVAVVGMTILAALTPTYFTSLADVTGTFNDANTTTGDTTADTILPTFGLLVAFGGLFAIVGLAIAIARLKKGA